MVVQILIITVKTWVKTGQQLKIVALALLQPGVVTATKNGDDLCVCATRTTCTTRTTRTVRVVARLVDLHTVQYSTAV